VPLADRGATVQGFWVGGVGLEIDFEVGGGVIAVIGLARAYLAENQGSFFREVAQLVFAFQELGGDPIALLFGA
jgi:hypothetical protein